MKQYTTPRQTAKIIGLGFEKPKSKVLFEVGNDELGYAYSIGELIEMLPTTIAYEIWWGEEKGMDGFWGLQISTNGTDYMWSVDYMRDRSAPLYRECGSELLDALFYMAVKLKEEGVI